MKRWGIGLTVISQQLRNMILRSHHKALSFLGLSPGPLVTVKNMTSI